jgi:hypothetical protein
MKMKVSHMKMKVSHMKMKVSHMKMKVSHMKMKVSHMKMKVTHMKMLFLIVSHGVYRLLVRKIRSDVKFNKVAVLKFFVY